MDVTNISAQGISTALVDSLSDSDSSGRLLISEVPLLHSHSASTSQRSDVTKQPTGCRSNGSAAQLKGNILCMSSATAVNWYFVVIGIT